MKRSRRLRARRGFTLAETLLSMTLMLTLIGLSTQLFRKQSQAVSTQNGRLDAQSNSRYALSMLDRELRMAGAGVVDAQPLLVEAGPLAITFNANLVALDTGDIGAVYINPDADSAGVDALKTNEKITLPGTSIQYPDSTYMQASGITSNAETISYWLSHDSTSSRANEYILFRRVNARPARIVAKGIIYGGATDTVFQYMKSDTLGVLTPISPASLPLTHSAVVHGSQADAGTAALIDSIRQVNVQFTTVYHDARTNADTFRRLQLTIHLMNAGLIHHSTCGNQPISVTSPTATVFAANGGTIPQTYVRLTWSPSSTDGGGERDVERYALYRRLTGATTFDQPFASVPGGSPSYTFQDTDIISGQSWIYGVAAQDCTPSSSAVSVTTSVVIP
jgi:type II secretory pathway pseudopilin PulG